ncbi:MAG: SAM-dependent methyltransferase, partial [Chloroflexota bacterium]|nr:SAM-dependent methyltransferase [Chloroflexota bacterium]
MNVLRALAENHAHPKGWLGKVVGWRLSIVNRAANDWVVGLLDLTPTDHVLEIGFGPGVGIQRVAAIANAGFVAGVDSSEVMLQAA